MLSSFRDRPFRPDAFSDRPLSFFSRPIQEDLANITAIDLIENDDRVARENWQNRQLTNLLRHAQARSKFWRQRMPSRILNHDAKKYLPVLAREDVAKQVELEGSLATTDGAAPMTYSSTGSTGTPVKIYVTDQASLSGGIIANSTMQPINLQFYQQPYPLPTGASMGKNEASFSGGSGAAFVYYAPSTALTTSGNGAIMGSIVGNTIDLKGGGSVHFDLALREQMTATPPTLQRLYWRDMNPPLR